MSQAPNRPSEEQLHAYVDGWLDEPERRTVEQYLGENLGESLRIDTYRQQNEALQALRALPEGRPFKPPEFRPLISLRTLALRAAAAVVLLGLGIAGGWWSHGQLERAVPAWERLVQQAERAHQTFVPEVLHPVEVTSEQEQHLGTWISRRLGTALTVPVLAGHGYDLVGGRLLPASSGPAAQFMYQNPRGNRVTLYVTTAPTAHRDESFRYLQSGSLWICYWIGEKIDFALIGEVDRELLKDIAKTVYLQLNHMDPPDSGSW